MTATTATEPVVLDSSAWLEYFTSDAKSESFAPYLEGEIPIFVPTVVLYEVRKILLLKHGKTTADIFYSEALKHLIVSFDENMALLAVQLSVNYKLSMADAIIYATAQRYSARLITSDAHFANLPGVVML